MRYACGLLWLQAGLWALAALGIGGLWIAGMATNWLPPAWAHSRLVWLIAEGSCIIVAACLSAGSVALTTALARGRAAARVAAVVLESIMVPFGWLFATYTANGEGVNPGPLAGLVGSALSLAAAVGLLSRQARRFAGRGRQTAAPR